MCEQCVCKGGCRCCARTESRGHVCLEQLGECKGPVFGRVGMGGHSLTPSGCPLSFVGKRRRRAGHAALFAGRVQIPPTPSARPPLPTPSVGITHPARHQFLPVPAPPAAARLVFFSNKEQKLHGPAPSPTAAELCSGPLNVGTIASSQDTCFGFIQDLSTCGEAFPG